MFPWSWAAIFEPPWTDPVLVIVLSRAVPGTFLGEKPSGGGQRRSSRGRSTDAGGRPESPLITAAHCRVGYELVTLSIPPATVKLTCVGNESGMWDFTLKSTRSQCVHCVEGYVYTEIFKEYYLPW